MQVHGPDGSVYPIDTRKDLVQYVYALQDDLAEHPEKWENIDLHTFLGALAAFLGDAHGYYPNRKEDFDADLPSWRLLADSLRAAAVYD